MRSRNGRSNGRGRNGRCARRREALAGTLALAAVAAAGCRHVPRAARASAPAWPPEEHCWWAAFRTALPPDSVATRSAHAYTALGLSGARWTSRADTAWAEAGPTLRAGPDRGGAVYAARVVAYRRGDTTFFRPFASVVPSDGAAPPAGTRADATVAGRAPSAEQQIGFCAEIGRASETHGAAPREEERDDSLPVWRRRPY